MTTSKKPHKPHTPAPHDQLTKLLGRAKHFIATVPKKYLYITVAAVIVISGATVVLQPKRTEAKFCSTLNEGMSGIESRYQNASGGGTMKEMGTLAGNLSEFSKLLRDLNDVAPPEIENDMKVVAESWDKNMDDGAKNGATAVTNPLGALANGLAGGIMNTIKNGASYNAVDTYSKEHCGRGLFSGSPSQNSTTVNESGSIDLAVDKTDFKPWEGKQHGLVLKISDEIILVNPDTKTATTKLKLPEAQGRTPGGDSGRSYRISTGYPSSISPNLRYIVGMFDSTDSTPSELAYYDLKDRALKATGTQPGRRFELMRSGYADVGGGYIQFAKDGLLKIGRQEVCRSNEHTGVDIHTGQDTLYDIANSKVTAGGIYSIKCGFTGADDVVVYNYKNNKYVAIYQKYTDPITLRYNGKLEGNFPCWDIVGLIDRTKLLCEEKTGMKVLDIANVIDKKSEKDDPDSYDYKVGRLHYDIKDSVTIDAGGEIGSYALSPDLKKVAFIRTESGTASLYIADLSSGESTKVGTLKANSAGNITVLRWL